jgi:hypothetical protein
MSAKTESFYFNLAYSLWGKKSPYQRYHDVFIRVTVPAGPDAKQVALEKFSTKFTRKEWGFQYTQEEFDTFPSKPWWKGTEHVMDFDELR